MEQPQAPVTPVVPVPAAPPVYVTPMSVRGIRVQDILSWVIFGLGVWAAIKGGGAIPTPPPLPQAGVVQQHFYGVSPVPQSPLTGAK